MDPQNISQVKEKVLHEKIGPPKSIGTKNINQSSSSNVEKQSHSLKIPTEIKKENQEISSPDQTLKELTKKFMTIVRKGNLNEITSFIDQYSLDVTKLVDESFRHTAIFHSVMIKDEENAKNVLKYFLEKGLDANYTDMLNQTALFYSAREGKIKCIELLIQNGCSVNHKDQYFQTPIYYAARDNEIDAVRKLVELGADLNNEDYNLQTPLYYAAKEGNLDVCKLLIDLGSKLNIVDKENQSPIQIAKKAGKHKIVDFFISLGAILPPASSGREKRNITKKNLETPEKIISKKYVLTYYKNGAWAKLEGEDLKNLIGQCPEIGEYLLNKKNVEEMKINSPPKGVQIFDHWEKAAKRILSSLWKSKDASLFHEPVDIEEFNIPDYPEVIKNPMDFGTIKQKLNTGAYANVKEFISDVELVFSNCILYNGETTEYGIIAKRLSEEFRNLQDGLSLSYYM